MRYSVGAGFTGIGPVMTFASDFSSRGFKAPITRSVSENQISHADQGRQRNSGALVARPWADLASGLTHNLKSVNERKGQHLVAVEVFAAPALGEANR